MKKTILIPIILSFLTSCSDLLYFQEFKVASVGGKENSDGIYFEDANCKVKYNFWSDGGNAGFEVFNKTESNLVIDLNKSFFIKNGYAYQYFQNRIFGNSSSTSVEATQTVSNYVMRTNYSSRTKASVLKSNSTEFIEKEFVTVPPKSKVSIAEFSVENERYTNCDLKKYPSSKEINPLIFMQNGSPIIFKNIIVYSTTSSPVTIEHNFYVTEIKNCSEKVYLETKTKDACGRSYLEPKKIFKNEDVRRFYISYK